MTGKKGEGKDLKEDMKESRNLKDKAAAVKKN
jgi:hypothetical protein